MKDIVRIDLPITRYKLTPEGLLFKMSVPDFGKLLKIIRDQADPSEKSAHDFYAEIRQLMTEAAQEYGPEYIYRKNYQDPNGIQYSKEVRVNVRQRFDQLSKKLDAADRRVK